MGVNIISEPVLLSLGEDMPPLWCPLVFIGAHFGWDKSRKFHPHRSDLKVFQNGINLLRQDKVSTQSSLGECFDYKNAGGSVV